MFDAIATSNGGVKPTELEGHLLVVEPIEHVEKVQTSFGESDAIRVTVHDITDQATYDNVLWFPKALVGSLKLSVGKRVLGVMGKGQAKAGQSAPWILVDASQDATAVGAATTYLTNRVQQTIAAPQPAKSPLDAALRELDAAGLIK